MSSYTRRLECPFRYYFVFFFNDTATTEIYTLSLHDALPISVGAGARPFRGGAGGGLLRGPRLRADGRGGRGGRDRKSTRLNSSHSQISYAVFCLKKKKKILSKSNVSAYPSRPLAVPQPVQPR